MPFEIRSSFIGNFRLGDNINYNFDTLELLYRHYNNSTEAERRLLRKPIILILVSITEALLHDFHKRIQTFTSEGVENVANAISEYVRGRRLDELEKLIASARKHDFFDLAETEFYDRMDELRRLRNRVHIQNTKNDFEPLDCNAFNESRKDLAERVLEQTLRTMLAKYDRGPQFNFVRNFPLPWDPHFPT
jgi:hypothetical protein